MPNSLDLSFLRRRSAQVRIATIAAICGALGGVYAAVAPDWYRSAMSVVPARQQKGGSISSLLGGELGGLASGLTDGMGAGADVMRIAAVLQGTAVTDAVIARFDLGNRYKQTHQEKTREVLWRHCDVKPVPKPAIVEMRCEDKDPQVAQRMLQYFAEYGNLVFRRVGVSSASEQVRFLEHRVGELRAQADEAAAHMREFQEKYGIVDLESQTRAVVGAMASLNNQRISKQLELGYARTFASGDEATAKQLESQIAVVDQRLRAMQDDGAIPPTPRGRAPTNGLFPAALTVPKLRAEFESLYRDRKVSEATLIFSLERLESARADEARDTSTFLVLDPAVLPTLHSRPRRPVIVVAALMLGLAIGVALEWLKSGGVSVLIGQSTPRVGRAA